MRKKLRKLVVPALVTFAVAAGWLFFRGRPLPLLAGLGLGGSVEGGAGESAGPPLPPIERRGQTITIASFNIQVFGEKKLARPAVAHVLARVVRLFDVVAVQEIRTKQQDLLARFMELVNADGSHYDYVIGPRLGRTSSKEQYAYIYNLASVECDRDSLYTVDDPDDLLHREPLVAAFRVRGPPASEAFTFTLVNIHTDPDEVAAELSVLDDVLRAVRNDGRQEDDVILLGDLNADDRHLGELGRISYIVWAISGMPTNTRGTKLYDNLLFDSRATVEFTGRAGVVDVMREFNLKPAEALEVSDHLPIWAEFGLQEGGRPGRVAARPNRSSRPR